MPECTCTPLNRRLMSHLLGVEEGLVHEQGCWDRAASLSVPAPTLPALDAEWAETEAALPKHWRLAISPYYPSGWEAYAYDIRKTPTSGKTGHSTRACYGDTPVAALDALREALRDAV